MELAPVGRAELALQLLRVFTHEVQNALLIKLAFGLTESRVGLVAEQALEDRARVDFGRQRRSGRAPGQTVRVSAAITRIAIARLFAVFAAEFERREARRFADLLRGELVNRNAVVNIRPGGLVRVRAGQEASGGARVIARPIAQRAATIERHAGD